MISRFFSRLFGWPLVLLWWAIGWRLDTPIPPIARFVVVGAPHTSNLDFVHLLPIALLAGRRPHVAIKHTVFRPPFGALLRAIGAIPIDRGRSHDVVFQLTARMRRARRMVLVFTPEGTRRRRKHWKSGFYHIAHATQVPIVPIALVYIDYRHKRVGCALTFYTFTQRRLPARFRMSLIRTSSSPSMGSNLIRPRLPILVMRRIGSCRRRRPSPLTAPIVKP